MASSPTIPLPRHPSLYLNPDTPKGRGVFTSSTIPAGTVLETCSVLVLAPSENATHIEHTSLYHYTYNWPVQIPNGKVSKTQAIVFGLGSMFNHSSREQNVGWERNLENQLITYRALRDIAAGEELCISYGDHLTFEDADGPAAGAVVENEDEHLSRIQLET